MYALHRRCLLVYQPPWQPSWRMKRLLLLDDVDNRRQTSDGSFRRQSRLMIPTGCLNDSPEQCAWNCSCWARTHHRWVSFLPEQRITQGRNNVDILMEMFGATHWGAKPKDFLRRIDLSNGSFAPLGFCLENEICFTKPYWHHWRQAESTLCSRQLLMPAWSWHNTSDSSRQFELSRIGRRHENLLRRQRLLPWFYDSLRLKIQQCLRLIVCSLLF